MDKELFELAVQAAERIELPDSGIGTRGEYRLHAALKYYVQPDLTMHEVKKSGFICDAVTDDGGVVEIQTASFRNLKPKLKKLLSEGIVTVVYPVIASKTIVTVDQDTGEAVERRSPKKSCAYAVFRELCQVKEYVGHPNFRLRLITVKAREFRVRFPDKRRPDNRRGWAKNYKRTERVPTELIDDFVVADTDGYRRFIPVGLNEIFFSSDIVRCAKIKQGEASAMLDILNGLGIVRRIGRSRSGYFYELV